MNNPITHLNSNAHYPTPDVADMATTARQITSLRGAADALFIKTSYMPSLHTKFKQLSIDINDTDRAVRDSAQKIAQQLKLYVKELVGFEQELGEEGIDEEDKDYLIAESLKLRSKASALVKVEDSALTQRLHNIDEKLNRQTTEGLITDQNRTIEICTADIERLAADLSTLQEQRKVLNDGIDALKSKGYAEQGQDAIVEVEKLIANGMTMPEAEVIKLALEQVKKLIADLENTVTFFALLRARDSVVTTISDKNKQQAAKQDDILMAEHRISFINTIHDIDTLRTAYVSEASKVTQATGFFLSTFVAGTASEQVASFIENVKPFNNCMNAIVNTRR